jgi:hypothetical protein
LSTDLYRVPIKATGNVDLYRVPIKATCNVGRYTRSIATAVCAVDHTDAVNMVTSLIAIDKRTRHDKDDRPSEALMANLANHATKSDVVVFLSSEEVTSS